MKVKRLSFVNEAHLDRQLIKYDIEPADVSKLMQQESIDVSSIAMKQIDDADTFNEYNKVFKLNDSETRLYYSDTNGNIALAAGEFAEMLFVYHRPVTSVREIKRLVENATDVSTKWLAYEIAL